MKVKSYYKADLLSFWDLTEEQQKEFTDYNDHMSQDDIECNHYWLHKYTDGSWSVYSLSDCIRYNTAWTGRSPVSDYWQAFVSHGHHSWLVHITDDLGYIYVATDFKSESEV